MNIDYEDRRDFYRMQFNWPIEVTEMSTGLHHAAMGRNLSAEGVSFYCTHAFAPGARLRVLVAPDKTLVSPLDAEVEVLRVTPENDGFVMAARICQMLR
ncbi:PilZ domain-containing protein [Thiorhodospira sibirica]|uniref:PilZ domain-containing protein n=1 Tax=Thiorhodospira sibirica TaxID=154347 RepID=UPI00022C1716|nr:PilZ domain-containing protein [Thiorhodospira sibirica]